MKNNKALKIKGNAVYATGKRKSSIARVWLIPGKGDQVVNNMPIRDYLNRDTLVMLVNQPLEITGRRGRYDIVAEVKGGGKAGQAGAIRHGISKALNSAEPELRKELKSYNFLTRDARVKERKKYGLAAARKKYQFSKR